MQSIKIFYGFNKKKRKLVFSNKYLNLTKKCNIKSIFSVPKGSLVIIDQKGFIIHQKKIGTQKLKFDRNFKNLIKKNLITYLKEIKRKYGNKCVVCLSGGLDSTIIAYYAKKIFKSTITLTASFNEKNEKFGCYMQRKLQNI